MKLEAQLKKLKGQTTFIVGNKKNAGKTTFLNSALDFLRPKTQVAYLSIGVDGEASDQIFGFPKPRVMAQTGDFLVTLEEALKNTKAKFKRLKTFPYKTVLGRPVLVEIISNGLIEIIGPENNTQLAKILDHLCFELGVKTILIDGAINRITQVSAFSGAQFVFMCRVDADRVMSAAGDLERIVSLSKCKVASGKAFKEKSMLTVSGALTHTKSEKIAKQFKAVVVDDITKVFLTHKELSKFLRSRRLLVKSGFKLAFSVINLFGVEPKTFINYLSDAKLFNKCVVNQIDV